MKKSICRFSIVYLAIVVMLSTFVGCEDLEPSSGATDDVLSDAAFAYFDSTWLVITPSGATINTITGNPILPDDGDRLNLQASGGTPPYSWGMRHTYVGEFQGSGDIVVYRRSRQGDNVIILTDASGYTKYAVVEQPYEEFDLEISPSSKTLSEDDDSVMLEAKGGRPSFTWDIFDGGVGQLIGVQGNTTIVYQRTTDGDNVVSVTDADGLVAFCLVSQPAEIALDVIPPTDVVAQGGTSQFQAIGGTPPYAWSVSSPTVGDVDANGLYTGNTNLITGPCTVYLWDSDGGSSSAVVTQQ